MIVLNIVAAVACLFVAFYPFGIPMPGWRFWLLCGLAALNAGHVIITLAAH